MVQDRKPKVGDYWCMGLLTSDFWEAIHHAIRYAKEHREEVTVSRYVVLDSYSPLMQEAAVIRSPKHEQR